MKKITPKSQHEVYGMHEGDKKCYPEFSIGHDQFPEGKDMAVGEHHHILLHVKKVDHSESKFQNKSGFEIHGIEHKKKLRTPKEDQLDEEEGREKEEGDEAEENKEDENHGDGGEY